MINPSPSKGGAFKGAGTDKQFTHQHAASMAHGASQRLATARALGGAGGANGAPAARLGAPSVGQAMGSPQMMARKSPGDWRAGVSALAAHGAGVSVGPNEIHQAVGKLVQAGHFTPMQGQALVQHHGPLMGRAGHQTMMKVAHVAAGGQVPMMTQPMGGGMPTTTMPAMGAA
jgi:hypothetical protein